jgi:hypothetical protein
VKPIGSSEVRGWYDLVWQIFKDLKSSIKTEKSVRFERYRQLFDSIRIIHSDYIDLFQKLYDEIVTTDTQLCIIKRSFLSRREILSSYRTLWKGDAQIYILLADDVAEKRYLTSVIWYFHYQFSNGYDPRTLGQMDSNVLAATADNMGGEGAWDSASLAFWYQIEELEDREEVRKAAVTMIDAINRRFAMMVNCYTQLENLWIFNKPAFESPISHLLK